MHTFDPEPLRFNTNRPDITPEAAWKYMQDFLSKYGISMKLADSDNLGRVHGKPPAAADLDGLAFFLRLESLGYAVSKFPVEFLRDRVKLNEIIIMEGTEITLRSGKKGLAGGEFNSERPGAVYLDRQQLSAFDHELGHMIYERMGCLGAPDQAFVDHNPGDIYDPSYPNKMSLDDYYEKVFAINQSQALSERVRSELRQAKSKILTVSDYSFESEKAEEDTAEIDQSIFENNIAVLGLRNSPVLAAKVRYELARLYTFDAVTVGMIVRSQKRPVSPILTP